MNPGVHSSVEGRTQHFQLSERNVVRAPGPVASAVETVAFDEVHASVALDAYSRFGTGGHPAALNFGDCCTYAVASVAGEPLLATGDDFPQTDLLLVTAGQESTGRP